MATTIDVPKARRAGARRGLWADRDFLLLWLGQTVSFLGTEVTRVALPLTAVIVLGASPGQMGLLGAAESVPFLLLTLLAGVWIDRHRRRPILVAANLLRALLLALVPLLAVLGRLRMEHLLAIAFLVGCCTVFFELAYQSYLPRLLPRDRLVEGNGKVAAGTSGAEIAGPGIGAALVGLVTAPLAIVADAVSFLVAGAALSRIRRPEEPPARTPAGVSARRQVADGFRVTLRSRYLIAFAGEAATYNVFWNAIQAVLVLFVVRELGLGAGTLGLVLAVGSVGALIGALLTARVAARIGIGRTMIGSAVLSNAGTLMIAFAAGPAPVAILTLAVAFFLRGVGMTGCNVQVYGLRQAIVPDELLGRVNGTYTLLTFGFVPLGALLGGLLGELLGLRPALLVAAAGLFFSWAWLVFSPARGLRELPDRPLVG